MKNIAIPLLGSRVSPNLLLSDELLIVSLQADTIINRRTLDTRRFSENTWLEVLDDSDIDELVCGGIDQQLNAEFSALGIAVTNNVAGELDVVLHSLQNNELHTGYGITYNPETINPRRSGMILGSARESSSDAADQSSLSSGSPAMAETGRDTMIDCLACETCHCLKGVPCPVWRQDQQQQPAKSLVDTMDVARDISEEPERILCRVAEMVYFCLGMGYKHLGVAYCIDLTSEARTLTHLLRRFFTVSPVCCLISTSIAATDAAGNAGRHLCHPVEMSHALNACNTDVNILVGLSIGCDIVINRLSVAPVSTLFVKDRLLANNPIGALYSKYQLDRLFP